MPKHALFTEGSSGGKHLLVNEALPGGQHAFFGGSDLAPASGWFSLAGGGDFVEEPTTTYRTSALRAARVGGPGGTGNYALNVTGFTIGNTYRAGCYIRNDRAVQAATSDAVFGIRFVTSLATVDPVPLSTWELAEGTFVATATSHALLWQLAIATSAPYDFAAWIADWYVIDLGP